MNKRKYPFWHPLSGFWGGVAIGAIINVIWILVVYWRDFS